MIVNLGYTNDNSSTPRGAPSKVLCYRPRRENPVLERAPSSKRIQRWRSSTPLKWIWVFG